MSSGEAEYISAAVVCMKASHIRILEYDLKHLGAKSYDLNNPSCKPSKIIIDNEAAKAMSECNKDTAGIIDMLPGDIIMYARVHP